ncbi:3-deoxy-manno-octulosonate cytidylyltransferase [Chromatocurvus halotolerans]|uniref:3-deoxy-manno-octulosonate cytidylyltransferase n=1 Tax=Chromatocurvus halotolerans TaxID=1132028 RepID=A0A4V2SBP1_9GAMM|nr:3-deoxy-manno-octulosonate cytidylyltransferase [Chromatocurvus halotolerans]TCO75730.1 3-deoxy-manno-octulosonate cytidylyltransferase (CMP-KDO synthetase) [Chromatocurvus halotolerans]
MSFTVIIPARYASTRLPGKPLLDIAGKPMLKRVWEQSLRSEADEVIIATDDQRIAEAARGWGAQVCMTASEHASGTDRLQEVVQSRGLADSAVVVNVQGDEPLVPPAVINQVAANLADTPEAGMATLSEPLTDVASLLDSNAVKVVSDVRGFARYFSRAPIPYPRGLDLKNPDALQRYPVGHWQRHIGLYAYRAGFLRRFVAWPQAPAELLEQLEQLRALHHGEIVHVAPARERVPAGVDTPADLDAVRRLCAASNTN